MDQECDGFGKEEERIPNGMEDDLDNANDMAEQEESTGSDPSLLLSGARPKRLRSKVWDEFTPIFADGKLVSAKCMHCHQFLSSKSSSGTGSLLRHQARCNPQAQKRPRQQKLPFLPANQKSMMEASSYLAQKKLPFLPTNQQKCLGTTDTMPHKKDTALPNILDNTNPKNQSHEAEPPVPEKKDNPIDTNQENPEVDQNGSNDELIRIMAMHGYLPLMMDNDRFRKCVPCLNPMVNLSSNDKMFGNFLQQFNKQKAKLKEKFAALRGRVCLSAHVWHYDLLSAFLCLSVHYIDDEWEKQQNIITFRAIDPSCNAHQLSGVILDAIGDWGLSDKVFSITLDDEFDDLVASSVKERLQKLNSHCADQSLFVVRYATHLLDQVIQVGLDELDKIMEKSVKCSKHTESPNSSAVQYSYSRHAATGNDWGSAHIISDTLKDFHRYMDKMHSRPSPVRLFEKVWKVKADLKHKTNICKDVRVSNVLKKMRQKFNEYWKFCCIHLCLPMVLDPSRRLSHIKVHVDPNTGVDAYIRYLHDKLFRLFNEYSGQVKDPNFSSGSKTSKEIAVNGDDNLLKYYLCSEKPYTERPITELDQYLHEPHLSRGEPTVLQWWKRHNLNYPTVARMARDMLAVPCRANCKVAIRTAELGICELGQTYIDKLVCIQDWIRSDGSAGDMFTSDLICSADDTSFSDLFSESQSS